MLQAPAVSITMNNWSECDTRWTRPQPSFIDEHRCYFPVKGEARMQAGQSKWNMKAGRVYLIPGMRAISHACEDHFHLHWLHFRMDTLAVEAQLAQRLTMFEWPKARWSHWQPVWKQLGSPRDDWTAALHCQVQAMVLDMLGDALGQLFNASTDGSPDPMVLQRLEPAITFMDSHFRENPPLEVVAASVHLSPIYFHQQFSSAFRLTPHNYMLRKRMFLARELLLSTSFAVSEVSVRAGYDNAFYFSRVFRRHFGLSPQQARKNWRVDAP